VTVKSRTVIVPAFVHRPHGSKGHTLPNPSIGKLNLYTGQVLLQQLPHARDSITGLIRRSIPTGIECQVANVAEPTGHDACSEEEAIPRTIPAVIPIQPQPQPYVGPGRSAG
jgi:hypothetical protein